MSQEFHAGFPVTFTAWERHQAHCICLGLILVLASALYMLNRRWLLQQLQQTTQSNRTGRDELCFTLVKSLSLAYAIRNYRFRGVQRHTEPLNVQFYDLRVHLFSGQCVLNGVTGTFSSGRLTAIMGPSGAGKSTFLNALCGRAPYAKTTGAVFVNGSPCKINSLAKVVGFVPQEDHVHATLTVREQLEFSAALRNPEGTSKAKILNIVDDVLELLDLHHIQTRVVGSSDRRGISGGEKKRVNIGLELVACPTILFLDEPTSGLDATNAHTILHSLKKLAQLGITIVTVIHQPRYSIFTLFDDVLLLAMGGSTAYHGPSNGVQLYFENLGFETPHFENPADFFMDVLSGEVRNRRFPDSGIDVFPNLWEDHIQKPWLQSQAETKNGETELLSCTVGDIDLAATILLEVEQHPVADDATCLLQEAWEYADKDGDGVLQVEELRRLLRRRSSREPDDDSMLDLLEALDADSNGVSKDKFFELLHHLPDLVISTPSGSARSSPQVSSSLMSTEVKSPSQSTTPGSVDFALPSLGFWMQYQLLLQRTIMQTFRKRRRMTFDILLSIAFASVCGYLHRDRYLMAADVMIYHMNLSLLIGVSCLMAFRDDSDVYRREAASGINTCAYYWAKVHVNDVYVVLLCVVYVTCYYVIRGPPEPSQLYLVPCLLLSAAASGWSYVVSVVVPPQSTTLTVVIVVVVFTGILGNPGFIGDFMDGGIQEVIVSTSMTRWSVQMVYLKYYDIYGDYEVMEKHLLTIYGNSLHQDSLGPWTSSILALSIMAICLRQVGFLPLWGQSRRCYGLVKRRFLRLRTRLSARWQSRNRAAATTSEPP